MKKDRPNNPSAFPDPTLACPSIHDIQSLNDPNNYGMTLRDYFAAKAINGFLSSSEMWRSLCMDSSGAGLNKNDYIAKEAYSIADAMLKQREL